VRKRLKRIRIGKNKRRASKRAMEEGGRSKEGRSRRGRRCRNIRYKRWTESEQRNN
jgi:hypothetical protein